MTDLGRSKIGAEMEPKWKREQNRGPEQEREGHDFSRTGMSGRKCGFSR
jgi:hypothetical protein